VQPRLNKYLSVNSSIGPTIYSLSFRGSRRRLYPAMDLFVRQEKCLEGRLLALASTYRQLTESNWSGVSLSEIVHLTLEPFTARTESDGPNVILSAKNAQNFSLALHELATNAMKYGALSSAGGNVSIVWTVASNGGGAVLKLRWQERGGPPAFAPSQRGFGTLLLESTFDEVNFDYAREGLICEFHVSLGKSG
jgi:two-component sensor histidine kinase